MADEFQALRLTNLAKYRKANNLNVERKHSNSPGEPIVYQYMPGVEVNYERIEGPNLERHAHITYKNLDLYVTPSLEQCYRYAIFSESKHDIDSNIPDPVDESLALYHSLSKPRRSVRNDGSQACKRRNKPSETSSVKSNGDKFHDVEAKMLYKKSEKMLLADPFDLQLEKGRDRVRQIMKGFEAVVEEPKLLASDYVDATNLLAESHEILKKHYEVTSLQIPS